MQTPDARGHEKSPVSAPIPAESTSSIELSKNENSSEFVEYPESVFAQTNEKWIFVVVVSIAAFLSTVSVPIYFPTLDLLAHDFRVSVSQINLTSTIYSIFQGISPIFLATASDSWGRRPIYFCCSLIYLAANIALANARSYSQLLGLRILQAFGGASTVSLLGGTIGDFSTKKTRGGLIGTAMGIAQLGNCFGPLIGSGIESQFRSWRAIFWALAILAGITLTLVFFFLPETNRHVVGNGSRAPPASMNYFTSRSFYIYIRRQITGIPKFQGDSGYYDEWILPAQPVKWLRWTQLFFQPRVLLILFPTAIHYTNWYMVLTAQSTLLSERYKFSTEDIGMTYLASGIGTLATSLITGKIMQAAYERQSRFSSLNIYKARLGYSFYASALEIVSTLAFGWCLHFHVSFYAPVVMTFVVSCGAAFYLSTTSAILVDLFPSDSAASQSCNNLARCLMCAGGLAALQSMMDSMTIGGCFSFMAGLCLAFTSCIWYLIRYYGPSRA